MRPRQVQDFIPTPMSMATAKFSNGMCVQWQKTIAFKTSSVWALSPE